MTRYLVAVGAAVAVKENCMTSVPFSSEIGVAMRWRHGSPGQQSSVGSLSILRTAFRRGPRRGLRVSPANPNRAGTRSVQNRCERRLSGVLRACGWLLVIAAPSTAWGQFHVAALQSLTQLGAQAGSTIHLSVRGDRLDELTELRFSHPAIRGELQTTDPLPFATQRQPHYGHFVVTVPAEMPPGRYEVRGVGRHGLTNPRSFLVTALPHRGTAASADDPSVATDLARDLWVQATVAPQQVHQYTIEHSQPGPLQVQLLAQQLDSPLIGQLTLTATSGKSIAAASGAEDLDPVLSIPNLPAGSYRLVVHDFAYRGGESFQYLLLASDRAIVPSSLLGSAAQPGQLPLFTSPVASGLPSAQPLADTDDEVDQLALTELPISVTRWFPQGQTDHSFDFSAGPDRQLAVEVMSHRLGQPTDPRLTIARIVPQESGQPQLQDLLHADDTPLVTDGVVSLGSRDPVTLFTPPAEATYRLFVRDLDIGTYLLARQRYRLHLREPQPGFDLVAYRLYPHSDLNTSLPFGSKLVRGGAEMIRVFALRRDGWTGPIRVTMENLPAGVTCAEGTLAANQDRVQLTVTADEQASGSSESIRIVGRNQDGSITATATPLTIVRGRGNDRNTVQTRITTSLPVWVSELDLAPLSVSLGEGNVIEVKPGASASLPIQLSRREGGASACVCRPRDFPPGVAAGEVTIAADQSAGAIEIKPNPDAPPGTYSIWLQVETTIKFAANPQGLARAEAYRNQLQMLHDDPAQAEHLAAIQAAITAADQRIEAARAAAAPQDQTVFIPTNHATIRVLEP